MTETHPFQSLLQILVDKERYIFWRTRIAVDESLKRLHRIKISIPGGKVCKQGIHKRTSLRVASIWRSELKHCRHTRSNKSFSDRTPSTHFAAASALVGTPF